MNDSSPLAGAVLTVSRRGAARRAAVAALMLVGTAQAALAGDMTGAGAEEVVAGINRDIAAEVHAGGDAVLSDAERRIALVEQAASRHTDFEYMAELVLGHRWTDATSGQRTQFVDQFRSLLLWTFSQQVVEHVNAETRFSATQTDPSGTQALVRTQVKPSSGPVKEVSYRLRAKHGQWKVFDVAIDGISIVSTYRSDFSSLAARLGVDGLIARITAKNRQLKGT